MPAQIIPVIMCGGAGTRLWPVSRESMPKQFVPLVGAGIDVPAGACAHFGSASCSRGRSSSPMPISASWWRSSCASAASRPTSCSSRCGAIPARRSRSRPCSRRERDRDALVLVLAADHVIRKPEEFREACRRAAAAAAEGRIVTFGIEPTYPATNYGYIRPGEKLNGASVRAVEAFVEKPDAATAATYVADRYLWNSGNFLFHAATMLGEIERFEPAMAEAAKAAVAGLTRDLDFLRLARGRVRPRAEEVDRLCGDGAHQARRGGARRSRLVRHRQLEHGLGRARSRRRRQCDRWSGRHAGQPQQPGALGGDRC